MQIKPCVLTRPQHPPESATPGGVACLYQAFCAGCLERPVSRTALREGPATTTTVPLSLNPRSGAAGPPRRSTGTWTRCTPPPPSGSGQEWLTADPTRRLRRRGRAPDRTRALPGRRHRGAPRHGRPDPGEDPVDDAVRDRRPLQRGARARHRGPGPAQPPLQGHPQGISGRRHRLADRHRPPPAPGCWTAAPEGRCSSPAAGPASPWPPPTSTPPPGAPACPTAGPRRSSPRRPSRWPIPTSPTRPARRRTRLDPASAQAQRAHPRSPRAAPTPAPCSPTPATPRSPASPSTPASRPTPSAAGKPSVTPPPPLLKKPQLRDRLGSYVARFCRIPAVPPRAIPEVTSRLGIDLNPVQLADPGQQAWLEAFIWPKDTSGLATLRGAIDLAVSAGIPPVVHGDATSDTARLLAALPGRNPVVVFTATLLSYLDASGRSAFTAQSPGSRAAAPGRMGLRGGPRLHGSRRAPGPRDGKTAGPAQRAVPRRGSACSAAGTATTASLPWPTPTSAGSPPPGTLQTTSSGCPQAQKTTDTALAGTCPVLWPASRNRPRRPRLARQKRSPARCSGKPEYP